MRLPVATWVPDHPRIRGEHSRIPTPAISKAGSSPHTRGARVEHGAGLRWWRIIPAYAGSTAVSIISAISVGDHPRIRGEHGLLGHAHLSAQGSSPHTRGAHIDLPRSGQAVRIIPAYAGSTRHGLDPDKFEPDHPRIRGEHCGRVLCGEGGEGSSPHTRGAL